MFAELDAIDNIGDMSYHEKHAFNLEHLAGITDLIHLRMPNFMPLIDMNKHLGALGSSEENPEALTLKSTLGCSERKGFFFASADSFGNCKVWEVDRKSSLFDFKFQEDRYNEFDAGSPPVVRAILQVKTCLVACLAYNEGSTTIQVWSLLTKEEVATVEHAHSLEVTAMVNYYPA